MSEPTATAGSGQGGDAAALSLIDMRRIDRVAGKSSKPGDLTHLLKHPSGMAPATRMTATPAAAPIAAPPAAPAPGWPPRAAAAPAPSPSPAPSHAAGNGIKRGDLTHMLRHPSGEAPPPAMMVAPATAAPATAAPRLPSRAALAPEPAPPPMARRASDRAAGSNSKRGDLTGLLKRPSAAAPSPPASVAPAMAPAAAPPPAALPPAAPAPELPARAAVAPEPAAPPAPRRAVALPEPYLAPDPELKPTYHVGGFAVLPPLAAPAPRAETASPLPYDDMRSVDELIDYWDSLRGGRELPLLSRLDRTRIAISWPNTLMVGFDADHMAQLTRLSRLTHDVLVTSAVTEWLLSCARRVARLGKAMETERDFADEPKLRQYRLLLLPFAGPAGASDFILCNLRRTG